MTVAVTLLVLADGAYAGEAGVAGKRIVESLKEFIRERPAKRAEQEELNILRRSERSTKLKEAAEKLELDDAGERMWAAADPEVRERVERFTSFLDASNKQDARKMANKEEEENALKECVRGFADALNQITCASIKSYLKKDGPLTDAELDHEASKAFSKASVSCGKHITSRANRAESLESTPLGKGIKTAKSLRALNELFNDVRAERDLLKQVEWLILYKFCH
jgi:hypothetical protein